MGLTMTEGAMDIAKYWKTIVDTLQDGLMVVDPMGRIIAANPAAERVTGYTAEELPKQRELCHSALRSLNGYIRYVRRQQQGRQEYGDRALQENSQDYITIPNLPIDE